MPRSEPPCGLFVTGTDTGVGKTAVAVAILRDLVARGRLVGAYKPVASGVPGGDPTAGDPGELWRAAGCPLAARDVCPQSFQAAIAPSEAARVEGRRVDDALLRRGIIPWRTRGGLIVVEGAGGLFSPLSTATLNVELARELGFPAVIVDSGRLGAIGRVLATRRAAIAEGLTVAAVVISHVEPLEAATANDPVAGSRVAEWGREELARRLSPRPVLLLRHGAESIEPAIDWEAVAATNASAGEGGRA